MNIGSIITHLEMNRRIDAARSDVHVAEYEVIQLRARLQATELACEGLWSLLKDKLGFTDEELFEAIEGINKPHEDGTCPHCNRHLLVKNGAACSFCGQTLNRSPFA